MKKLLKISLTLVITAILVTGIIMPEIIMGTPASPAAGNWYQQFLPNIGGRTITDVFFLDSLTGWSVTNATNQVNDTIFVLKTTNSGNNWAIQYSKIQVGGGFSGYFKVYFLNQNTGYTSDVLGVYKTTDGGSTWASLNAPVTAYTDMSVLNTDTIWIVSAGFGGGVFRTTNGGVIWQNQLNLGSQNPDHIYMYNARIGFISNNTGTYLRKTTDSGISWTVIFNRGFNDIFFVDSLKGWSAFDSVRVTTNGGLNWQTQILPYGGYNGGFLNYSFISQFSVLNNDTLWGVGGRIAYPNTQLRGLVYRTTNGGINWLFQLPDTSINIGLYKNIKFINKQIGWAYGGPRGIHTINGGDTSFYIGIVKISNIIPKDFELKQNYPNPFNPRTVIPYKLKKSAYVRLIAYEITGKETQIMVDQHQEAGEYEVVFIGKFAISSGVYFYRMEVTDDKTKQLFTETKKMVLIK